jgi:hypothetical protein
VSREFRAIPLAHGSLLKAQSFYCTTSTKCGTFATMPRIAAVFGRSMI